MDQIRITFLGTSAGTPTRERNVSSLAVTLDGRVLLFDCGEGTQHQILRSDVVRSGSIDAIFITHLHGDHLFGLPGLLATLGLNGREQPLVVCGPRGLLQYLEAVPYLGAPYGIEVREIDGEGGEVWRGDGVHVEARAMTHSVPCNGFAVVEDDRPGRFDVEAARAAGVPEGPLFGRLQRGEDVALPDGRVVRSADVVGPKRRGRRVVFCTDTRPCDAAVELARDADVLVHEATYGDDFAREAEERSHSTAREAAEIAARAGVGALVLTHFSGRYSDVEPLLREAGSVFPETSAAADFLTLPVR